MEKFKKLNPVLIVSDYFERFKFIKYHVICQSMSPVWYSNILIAREAIRVDAFSVVIIDLSLPLKEKLLLIKDVRLYQPDTIIITIGKTKYLETAKIFTSIPFIKQLDAISLLPDKLKVVPKNGADFGNMATNAYGFLNQSLY